MRIEVVKRQGKVIIKNEVEFEGYKFCMNYCFQIISMQRTFFLFFLSFFLFFIYFYNPTCNLFMYSSLLAVFLHINVKARPSIHFDLGILGCFVLVILPLKRALYTVGHVDTQRCFLTAFQQHMRGLLIKLRRENKNKMSFEKTRH